MLRTSLIKKEPSRFKKRSYETKKRSDAHFSILQRLQAWYFIIVALSSVISVSYARFPGWVGKQSHWFSPTWIRTYGHSGIIENFFVKIPGTAAKSKTLKVPPFSPFY